MLAEIKISAMDFYHAAKSVKDVVEKFSEKYPDARELGDQFENLIPAIKNKACCEGVFFDGVVSADVPVMCEVFRCVPLLLGLLHYQKEDMMKRRRPFKADNFIKVVPKVFNLTCGSITYSSLQEWCTDFCCLSRTAKTWNTTGRQC